MVWEIKRCTPVVDRKADRRLLRSLDHRVRRSLVVSQKWAALRPLACHQGRACYEAEGPYWRPRPGVPDGDCDDGVSPKNKPQPRRGSRPHWQQPGRRSQPLGCRRTPLSRLDIVPSHSNRDRTRCPRNTARPRNSPDKPFPLSHRSTVYRTTRTLACFCIPTIRSVAPMWRGKRSWRRGLLTDSTSSSSLSSIAIVGLERNQQITFGTKGPTRLQGSELMLLMLISN